MAEYRISGVWKNNDGVITHYAINHPTDKGGFTKAAKTSKQDAIRLLETDGNKAKTWIWDYTKKQWKIGEDVVVAGTTNKYLKTYPDNQLYDNLAHLIYLNWLS